MRSIGTSTFRLHYLICSRKLLVSSHPDRDLSSMVLTRVAGVTYSHLSANFCVTPGRLVALLDSLKRLHTCEGSY